MALYLLTGGVRSGKSGWAERFAKPYKRKTYIATAQPIDEEMMQRIDRHRRSRGEEWLTIEAGQLLLPALIQAADRSDCVVVDCLTVWTASIMNEEKSHDALMQQWVDPVIDQLPRLSCDAVLVTNEVGMGVHPSHESGRRYRDLLGSINQRFAQVCDHVFLFVAGIPMVVKGKLPDA